MAGLIPKSATLLTPLDTPRNQGPGNRLCGYVGPRKALELMLDRSPRAGQRLSLDFLRFIAQDVQGVYGDAGTTPAAMARALEFYGVCLDHEYSGPGGQKPPESAYQAAARNKPIRMVPMPYIEGDDTGSLSPRYWIAKGYPLIANISIHSGYGQVSGPTSNHTWNSSGTPIDEHITCFAAYDEHRIIAADSGAGVYGDDNGLVGFTNDKFEHGPQRCVNALWMIVDGPARPKPVEGYMPEPAKLTQAELGPDVAFARAALKAAEEAATEAKRAEWAGRVLRHQPVGATGWQWAVDAFVKEGLTDRNADIVFRQVPGWFLGKCDELGLDTSKLAKDPS